jgi:argininosuccinate lyase
MSYNRDLQEVTPHFWQGISAVREGIPILAEILATAALNPERMEDEAGRGFSTATELADRLVRDLGIPFRTAHTIVGKAVRAGSLDQINLEKSANEAFGISLKGMGLTRQMVEDALDVRSMVRARKVTGGPAPAAVKKALKGRKEQLRKDTAATASLDRKIREVLERLLSEARGLLA